MDTSTDRVAYRPDELIPKLGVSRGVIYEQIARGEIPHIRLGRRILVPKARFDAWLEGRDSSEVR